MKVGESVKAGQSIGKLGGSGISGGILRERKFVPHLHLEFLKPSESTGKRSNKELQSFWGGQSVSQVLANFEDPYKILVKMGAKYVN